MHGKGFMCVEGDADAAGGKYYKPARLSQLARYYALVLYNVWSKNLFRELLIERLNNSEGSLLYKALIVDVFRLLVIRFRTRTS